MITTRASADYVVVGGGSAGAIVARRLADAGAEVALVEAGATGEVDQRVLDLRHMDSLITRSITASMDAESEFDYDHAVTVNGPGNPHMRYSCARLLGGCSSHNGCIAFRAPDWDMRAWEASGAVGWGPSGTRPYFDRVFAAVNMESSERDNALIAAFVDAATAAGLPPIDLSDPSFREGVGWIENNKRGMLRESSAVAYLFPLERLPGNLRLFSEHTALLLEIGGDRARAVITDRGWIEAREELVVCSGTFGSAKLLMLSGIGPADELQALGIDPVCDLPVGRHLVDHPASFILLEADRPLPAETGEAAAFLNVGEAPEGPDIMFHFYARPYDVDTVARGYPTSPRAFAISPNVAHACSEGRVRLTSSDPAAVLSIEPRYFSDPDGHDRRVMLAGMRFAREILGRRPLATWIERELAPGSEVTDEALLDYAISVSDTSYHPSGTCRMSAVGDPSTVVDPELRVRGIEGLRVADASVFPAIPTLNPNISCMMIGEKASDLILNNRSTSSASATPAGRRRGAVA
jgi:choline dehydrogenase